METVEGDTMFGWRRKNDGFVWREYVRTTILVRRDQRRQKLENMRDAAVAGVRSAGHQGAALGAAGARSAATAIATATRNAALAAYDFLTVGLAASWLWLADRAGWLGKSMGDVFGRGAAPLVAILRQPVVSLSLAMVALVSAISAISAGRGLLSAAAVVALIAIAALGVARASEITGLIGSAFRRTRLDRIAFPNIQGLGIPRLGAGSGSGTARAALVAGALIAVVASATWMAGVFGALLDGPSATVRAGAAPGDRAQIVSGSVVEGKGFAVSAARLRVGTTEVRLAGVEAPEAGQTCGSRSCTATAKAALQKLVQGKRPACTITGSAEDGSATARCNVDGVDLAAQLVRAGHVFSDTGLFASYGSAEREARNGKLGVWRSNSERPAEHRARLWDEAKRSAPDGCPIKGVVSGDGKTYLAPGAPNYERTKVRPARGERWFCSEGEAQAAGWKPLESL